MNAKKNFSREDIQMGRILTSKEGPHSLANMNTQKVTAVLICINSENISLLPQSATKM